MRKKTRIVGLKHRGINMVFLRNLSGESINFILEPENKFDPYAVKCLVKGKHFGYINKNDSRLLSNLIRKSIRNNVKILAFDEYSVDIEVIFDLPETVKENFAYKFENINEGNCSGIYEISFRHPYDGEAACYIGQSVNINRRLRAHYAELERNEHHNSVLQEAWNDSSKSFHNKIIERCPLDIDEFEKQIWLFRKESDSIKNSKFQTVNRIDADIVLTNEAKIKLRSIVRKSIEYLKEKKKAAILEKEAVGQEIINCGIMKEERFWDGWQRGGSNEKKYLTVKASNILTWLNKTRYGMLDYRPKIDTSNPRYKELKQKIVFAHSVAKNLEKEIKLIKEFSYTIEHKGKYDTCKIESLEKFLVIVESAYKPKSEIPKKIINCPNCSIQVRIPSDRKVKFTCPNCAKIYIAK